MDKSSRYNKFVSEDIMDRSRLIEMGIIIEDSEPPSEDEIDPATVQYDPNSDESQQSDFELDSFEGVDYDLQNELINFFVNNPGAEPELLRQYALSIGVEPDELQKQENILLSQLLKIYVRDSSDLGYGSSLVDDEMSDEISQMVQPAE